MRHVPPGRPRPRLRALSATGASAFLLLLALGLALGRALASGFAQAPPVRGLDWDGRAYDLAEDEGRVRLLFFGYTRCADICPGSFARARRLRGELGAAEAAGLAVVFVSVDPQRDAGPPLAAYVPAFDPSFHGLTLAPDELARTLAAYGAVALRRPRERADGDYTLDHTSSFFLIDRAGRLRRTLPFDGPYEELLAAVRALLAEPGAPRVPRTVRPTVPAPAPEPAVAAEPEARATLGPLTVHAARMRPSSGAVGAAYLAIENHGAADERLLGVHSAAERTELHETVQTGETAGMQARPEGFVVPAHGTLELRPGGKHLMLLELGGRLAAGDTFELELSFEHAGALRLDVPVLEAGE